MPVTNVDRCRPFGTARPARVKNMVERVSWQSTMSAPVGFDNEKYLEEQSRTIRERAASIRGRLHLGEFASSSLTMG
jgi:hypothetical protein